MNRSSPPLSATPAAPPLVARRLGRSVRGRWIWRGIDLELRAGERLALRGPTGAGKSLLLRTLVLLDPVEEGEVLFHGQPPQIGQIPLVRSRIVYLAQRPAFRSGTVGDVLRRPYRFGVHHKRRFDEARAVRLFDELGRSSAFLAQDTGRLSGGEAQLVALVRALLLDPEVLLLDEPTAAMDADTTARAEAAVSMWLDGDEARALIWVSHDPTQLERMTNHSVVLGQR